MSNKSRNYAGTDFVLDIEFWKEKSHLFTYAIGGYETCPNTNKKHIQFMFVLENPRSFNNIRKEFSPRHIEPCKKSILANIRYCEKDNNLAFEFGGKPKTQGKRTDIDEIKELVKSGASQSTIWENAKSFQAFKFGLEGMKIFSPKRNWIPNVYWCYGPTGSGKSQWARNKFPNAWWSGLTGNFPFEGYQGEEDIILDDIRNDSFKFNDMLRICDSTELRVGVKGSSQQLLAKNIVITCPMHPLLFYENTNEDINQLIRRITEIIFFGVEQKTGTEVGL